MRGGHKRPKVAAQSGAARLARSANPTLRQLGQYAVRRLGNPSHWPWIDFLVIGSVSYFGIRAALQEDQDDTNRGPPRGGLPPFSRFASSLKRLEATYRRG
jgi:hypothetical protein